MELESNHIQHYPIAGENALKVKCFEDEIHELLGINTYKEDNKKTRFIVGKYHNVGGYMTSMVKSLKPLLRPMSDLYREVDGKIGIVEIYKMMYISNCSNPVIDGFILRVDGVNFEWVDIFNGFSTNGDHAYVTLEVADYLDENKYDWRYDLIGQDLAIDKNSIEDERINKRTKS